jgi:hypothetical protein
MMRSYPKKNNYTIFSDICMKKLYEFKDKGDEYQIIMESMMQLTNNSYEECEKIYNGWIDFFQGI